MTKKNSAKKEEGVIETPKEFGDRIANKYNPNSLLKRNVDRFRQLLLSENRDDGNTENEILEEFNELKRLLSISLLDNETMRRSELLSLLFSSEGDENNKNKEIEGIGLTLRQIEVLFWGREGEKEDLIGQVLTEEERRMISRIDEEGFEVPDYKVDLIDVEDVVFNRLVKAGKTKERNFLILYKEIRRSSWYREQKGKILIDFDKVPEFPGGIKIEFFKLEILTEVEKYLNKQGFETLSLRPDKSGPFKFRKIVDGRIYYCYLNSSYINGEDFYHLNGERFHSENYPDATIKKELGNKMGVFVQVMDEHSHALIGVGREEGKKEEEDEIVLLLSKLNMDELIKEIDRRNKEYEDRRGKK